MLNDQKQRQQQSDQRRRRSDTPGTGSGGNQPREVDPTEYLPAEEYTKRMTEYTQLLDAATALNTTRDSCLQNGYGIGCGAAADVPEAPDIAVAGEPADTAPALTPQQIAYIATARLTLTAPDPKVGPDPTANEWNMAAVGYPLWLWVDGDTTPAPVTDTVLDAYVRLTPRLAKVRFDMGDGGHVTCTDATTRWTRAVTPGTPSPSCGYRYQQPSLPDGDYTITATTTWAVDWQTSTTAGTITVSTQATRDLPVGELHVLVR